MHSTISRAALPATIGLALAGGFFGGIVRIGAHEHAVVWAPKATGETAGPWHKGRQAVAGATSCFDSLANTLAMADAGSPIAKWALTLNINGHTDWCLPARDVLELAYRHLKPTDDETWCSFRDGDNPSSVPVGYPYTEAAPILQTTVEAFKAGGDEAFDARWYWSSTQSSESYAWYQYFDNGCQSSDVKSFVARARAVRLIQLTA